VGAGLLQIVAGLLRMGQWFRAISPAVIYGMLAGIGVLIFSAQFHVAVDDKPKGSGLANLLSIPSAIVHGIFPIDGSQHEKAALIGLLTIFTLIVWNKWKPVKMIPGALVAVVTASGAAALFGLNSLNYVRIPENLFGQIAPPSLDILRQLGNWTYAFEAAALAFVASAETLLSASAVDRMHHGPRAKYDRELTAQGIGNTICGFVGGLPMTGVIVRSAANVGAGARTRLSTILHGFWLLICVALFPHLLELIPTCSLAALLVFTGYKLVNIDDARRVASYGRVPFLIYLTTMLTIVVVDLLTGVVVGIALSLAKLLWKATHLDLRLEPDPVVPHRMVLTMRGAATFVRLPKLADVLEEVPPGTELHVLIDDLFYIDHTCLDLLREWEKQHASEGGRLLVEWEGLRQRYERLPAEAPLLTQRSP
jgi:MFS superfamily sulfate permease-like transporter